MGRLERVDKEGCIIAASSTEGSTTSSEITGNQLHGKQDEIQASWSCLQECGTCAKSLYGEAG